MTTTLTDSRDLARIDKWTEQLHRLNDFRRFLDSNVLFPYVPDSIVNPMRAEVNKAEHILVTRLYDYGAIDRVVMIDKTLADSRR